MASTNISIKDTFCKEWVNTLFNETIGAEDDWRIESIIDSVEKVSLELFQSVIVTSDGVVVVLNNK